MNANAILALISDLYAQLTAAQDRIAVLEAQLRNIESEHTAGGGDSARSGLGVSETRPPA